jgi:methylenetetrahydrofolate--tRNA-(uracil-5-)-methyltransferase
MTSLSKKHVTVIGGGLAGSEAAWQAARAGCEVTLCEMRPEISTPAHHTSELAELVCSNSFGASAPDRATGLLQAELSSLGSIIMDLAHQHNVPAGGALAVDREHFSSSVTKALETHPRITLIRGEVPRIPSEGIVVIATGPLTSPGLAEDLAKRTGSEYLSFFDAASPIICGHSINRDIAFLASRYNRGEAAYLNCPMSTEQYQTFWEALCAAEDAPRKDFDRTTSDFFEGCLPIEELGRRGRDTMRFGPLKPVGIRDSRRPETAFHAIVQLRMEDRVGRLWNMVGFQTNLRWGEQERVFRLIPGLEQAEFIRKGVMHRNTFLNAPKVLAPTLQFTHEPRLLAAGQLTGTEGYIAACAGGWLAGTNAARLAHEESLLTPPQDTMLGALLHFITSADPKTFQPMPPNFGLFGPLEEKLKGKRARAQRRSEIAQQALISWGQANQLPLGQRFTDLNEATSSTLY